MLPNDVHVDSLDFNMLLCVRATWQGTLPRGYGWIHEAASIIEMKSVCIYIYMHMIIFPLARRDPTVQVADPARDPLRTAWTPASALPIWEQIERTESGVDRVDLSIACPTQNAAVGRRAGGFSTRSWPFLKNYNSIIV